MGGLPFRTHSELEPSGKVSILGGSLCSPDQMRAYAARRNPQAPDLAELYLEIARNFGIRGDVAFCQAVYDTRTWTLDLLTPRYPTLTQAIWGCEYGEWTASGLERKVERHLRLLQAFASMELLADGDGFVQMWSDNIGLPAWRGNVVCWEDLNGKWTVPGTRYGQDIVALWRNMRDWTRGGEQVTDDGDERNAMKAGKPETTEATAAAGEAMQWLGRRELLPSPPPRPARLVTWGELAVVLRKWGGENH